MGEHGRAIHAGTVMQAMIRFRPDHTAEYQPWVLAMQPVREDLL
jgi:hypothetical protein